MGKQTKTMVAGKDLAAISESLVDYRPGQVVDNVGVDIGYRATKAVRSDSGLYVIFPSVIGAARSIKFRAEDILAKYPGDQIEDETGASWFVGDLAQSQLKPEEQQAMTGRGANSETYGNNFRVRMLKAALGKLFPGLKNGDVVHIRLATGLPVDHMDDREILYGLLKGTHYIKTDKTEFTANIFDVSIMPQPYGRIYAASLTADGKQNPDFVYKVVGVADVGGFSTDLAVDNAGEYVDGMSGSNESGVHVAQDMIAEMLEKKYREKPSMALVEEILRTGKATIYGEVISFKKESTEAKQPIIEATLGIMTKLWRTAMTLDKIYITGGGGEICKVDIQKAFKNAVVSENPQGDNARGYANYAAWLSQQVTQE